jgi:hypothetical protein
MPETRFDPPILLNRDALANLPKKIATRRQAVALLEKLPPCGIQWCGVAACLETYKDVPTPKACACHRARTLWLSQLG